MQAFAVVSAAREFSQIKLITVLIITAVVEIETHMLAITHGNTQGKRDILHLSAACSVRL